MFDLLIVLGVLLVCFDFCLDFEIILSACHPRCVVRMLWSYIAILLSAILYINLLSKSISWQAAKKVNIVLFTDEKKL